MPRRRKEPTGKQLAPGRQFTKYRPKYAEDAFKLALLGLTNPQLGEVFGVSHTVVDQWLAYRDDFAEAVYRGRYIADAHVAEGLYKRATGYFVDEESTDFEGHKTTFRKHVPADVKAAALWLRIRQPEHWRDAPKQIDHNVSGGVTIDHRAVSAAEAFLGRVLEFEPRQLEADPQVADEKRPVLSAPVRLESRRPRTPVALRKVQGGSGKS